MINILIKECDFETLRLSFSRLEGIQNEAKVNSSSIILSAASVIYDTSQVFITLPRGELIVIDDNGNLMRDRSVAFTKRQTDLPPQVFLTFFP